MTENRDMTPHAVACMRGGRRTGHATYDAEVAVDGEHYLVGEKFETREAAIAEATKHANNLKLKLRSAVGAWAIDHKFGKAKP